jgi:hypothetical protein
MKKIDLSQPFQALVKSQVKKNLLKNLKQVNVVLSGYAQSIGCKVDQLSVMDVCIDDKRLHIKLDEYINNLDRKDSYIGENRARIKLLVKNLPWPIPDEPVSPVTIVQSVLDQTLIYDQLPPGLCPVWTYLRRPKGLLRIDSFESQEDYLENRLRQPLSRNGAALFVVLLKVYQENQLQDVITLIEKYREQICKELEKNSSVKSKVLIGEYYRLRQTLRAELKYEFEERQIVTIPVEQFPPTLREEIYLFKERALKGSIPDIRLLNLARNKYALDLEEPRSPETVSTYIEIISLALGYIPREMYSQDLSIKDFLKLLSREIIVDEVREIELYNPLVDYYRQRELNRHSDRKKTGYDSVTFVIFLNAIKAVAAYNGVLGLRAKLGDAYTPILDSDLKEKRKKLKKVTYDRKLVQGRIDILNEKFYQIISEYSYMSKKDGTLSRKVRANLNLCLFYIALLGLRYLGIRQQCERNCKVGVNVTFGSKKSVHFYWPVTKNNKGIIHSLDAKKHGLIQGKLISAMWAYYKNIYPYISGAPESTELPEIKEKRRVAVDGQFFLKIANSGLCVHFTNRNSFGSWFTKQAKKYLDIDKQIKESGLIPNPQFWRGLFGDWLHQDHNLSEKDTADMAGDTEAVYSSEYLEQSTDFDATATWTKLNQQIEDQERQREQRAKPKAKPEDHDEERAFMRDLVRKENSRSEKAEAQSESLKAQLAAALARIEELEKRQPEKNV